MDSYSWGGSELIDSTDVIREKKTVLSIRSYIVGDDDLRLVIWDSEAEIDRHDGGSGSHIKYLYNNINNIPKLKDDVERALLLSCMNRQKEKKLPSQLGALSDQEISKFYSSRKKPFWTKIFH